MSEEEAKTKWCCAASVPGAYRCIASACMAWRWRGVPNPDWKPETMGQFPDLRHPASRHPTYIASATEGFCGLAGAPQ